MAKKKLKLPCGLPYARDGYGGTCTQPEKHKGPCSDGNPDPEHIGILIPMGVSQWLNHGIKYGYLKFFLERLKTCQCVAGQGYCNLCTKSIGSLNTHIAEILKALTK